MADNDNDISITPPGLPSPDANGTYSPTLVDAPSGVLHIPESQRTVSSGRRKGVDSAQGVRDVIGQLPGRPPARPYSWIVRRSELAASPLHAAVDFDTSAVFQAAEEYGKSIENVQQVPVRGINPIHEERHVADAILVAMPPDLTTECGHLFEVSRKCLLLRDKYMVVSHQRLGDNPKDHDGTFHGFASCVADRMGVRCQVAVTDDSFSPPEKDTPAPRKIYQRPRRNGTGRSRRRPSRTRTAAPSESDGFDFAACEIPGAHAWGSRSTTRPVP
ncbi:hypothetical protein FA95DRAFT_1600224, partial [Auriscalpium vulgare]